MTNFKKSALAISTLAVMMAGACSSPKTAAPEKTVERVELSPMDIALNAERRGEAAARDIYRNPKATLEFMGLKPQMSVIEIWPGAGWYSDILSVYAAETEGTYTAALFPNFNERITASNTKFKEKYAASSFTEFGKAAGPLGAESSVDMVLTFRNVHNWMGGEYAEKAFADFYAVLKPGGILGVVEHRLPAAREQDPRSSGGYVQEAYVKALATEAGFEFVEASDINANPKDTADHPLGVWTLPPVSRRANRKTKEIVVTDGAKYEAIGESDRMTLKFRKPALTSE